jgi:hypothetical protein
MNDGLILEKPTIVSIPFEAAHYPRAIRNTRAQKPFDRKPIPLNKPSTQ